MATINANRRMGNLVGRSWSPFGRAGPLTGTDGYGSGTYWLFYVFVRIALVMVVLSAMRSTVFLDNSNFYPALLIVACLALFIDEYRMHCWRVQRLHDIGKPSWPAFVKRLPVWFFMLGILGLFAWFFLSEPEPLNAGVETAQHFILVILLSVGITFPVIALVGGTVYFRRILRPFNEYLATTPGDPGPNEYGPPPAP